MTITSLAEMACRKRPAGKDPVPLKNSIQADVSATSTLVPAAEPVRAHGVQVSVPADALHVQLLLEAHRSAADEAFQREMHRLTLGAQAERPHGAVDEVFVDVDIGPSHAWTIHHYV